MVTTRRGNGTPIKTTSSSSPLSTPSKSTSTSASNTTTPTPKMPVPQSAAFLPTPLEAMLLTVYPLTLILGSLFSHLSPTTHPPLNQSTYSVAAQSFQPGWAAPSYFARKSNIFNVYFVKLGWLWTTLALAVFTLSRRRRSVTTSPQQLLHPLARYALATTLWFLTTQWCAGPALIDRNFRLTGGTCTRMTAATEQESPLGSAAAAAIPFDAAAAAAARSRLACKVAGGAWHGGHDISGHVFLLVLGSGMLWLEMLPVLFRRVHGLAAGRVVRAWDGGVVGAVGDLYDAGATPTITNSNSSSSSSSSTPPALSTKAALAVAGLSWWMLLMTAAFFHTWFEKLTGLLVAGAALYLVYFLPRGVPALRAVVGMPGA